MSEFTAQVGDLLPEQQFTVSRDDLVRYAGASGDFNPIHYSDRVAGEVGLPGVIAHGMLTMAFAARLASDWVGDPGALVSCRARFTKPVVVPDDGIGATVTVSGVVAELPEPGLARIDVTASCGPDKVLGRARAVVRLPRAATS